MLAHDDHIFYPNAAEPWNIKTGLDGEDHARFKFRLRLGTQGWLLMDVQADPMAKIMAETVALANRNELVAR